MANGQIFDAECRQRPRDESPCSNCAVPPGCRWLRSVIELGGPRRTGDHLGNANGTGKPLTHEPGAVTDLSRTIAAEDEFSGTYNNLGGLIESSTTCGPAIRRCIGQQRGPGVGLNAAATINSG